MNNFKAMRLNWGISSSCNLAHDGNAQDFIFGKFGRTTPEGVPSQIAPFNNF
jgi:hypothetical protein